MANTKARMIEKVRTKMNGIIIVPKINIKIWLRMLVGIDCKMVIICRRPFLITLMKTFCNQRTSCHQNACLWVNKLETHGNNL